MPMGIVSEKEFITELEKTQIESPSESITGEIVDVNKGRGKGSVEVPESLRNIIGEESAISGRQSAVELASRFGISPSSVSAYGVGATSTASYDRRPNESVINGAKERVSKIARNKLLKALHKITDEKLDNVNAKDLAGIAKDMSAVVKAMEPASNGNGSQPTNTGPTFVFYAPQVRDERHYDIVPAKE